MAVGDNEYQEPGQGIYRAKAPSITSPKLVVAKEGQACALVDREVLSLSALRVGLNRTHGSLRPCFRR
eukprot:6212390-Prymnesium_polylepis.2